MIPDYCEAMTAYRVWDAWPSGLLAGQAHYEPWAPYEPMVGRCGGIAGENGAKSHLVDGKWVGAPAWGCDCGIYALKLEAVARQRWLDCVQSRMSGWWSTGQYSRPEGRVWGTVKLWGRIVEHQAGYRAQFAYPSALKCHEKELAAKVAELYGVPCEVVEVPKLEKEDAPDAAPFWRAIQQLQNHPTTFAPPPTPKTTGLITPASIASLKQIGASRWQRRAQSVPKQKDWREVLKAATHAVKNDPGADELVVQG